MPLKCFCQFFCKSGGGRGHSPDMPARQSTLSSFVNANAPPRVHFVLRENAATFDTDEPPAATRVGDIHLRWPREGANGALLHLWTTAPESAPFTPERCVTDASLLTSMLQKAVRRQMPETAALAAAELVHLSPFSLAKRLPIVAVEDVQVDASLTRCVWMMLACSIHYKVTDRDAAWLVGYARSLASCDAFSPWSSEGAHATASSLWRDASKRGDGVAMSLLCRSSFGGMSGDVRMLLRAASSPQSNAKTLPICCSMPTGRMSIAHAIPAAVDFHCEPSMLPSLSSRYGIPESDVKDAIWSSSSKINKRSGDRIAVSSTWTLIREEVEKRQRRRLRKAFAKV